MKVKAETTSDVNRSVARDKILDHVLYTEHMTVNCMKECIASVAFLSVYNNDWPISSWPLASDINTIIDMEDEEMTDKHILALYKYILKPRAEAQSNINFAYGTIVKAHARRTISTKYEVVQLSPCTDEDAKLRFKKIVCNYSNKCTYERSGDVYIHLLLRGKLKSYVNALIPSGHQPYDAISEDYGDAANDLVRPYIEAPPATKFIMVKWDAKMDMDGFHFIVGLLREMLDGLKSVIRINSQVCYCAQSPDVPQLVAFSMDFDIGLGVTYGYVYQNKLYLPPKSDTPLLDFLVQYIRVCFASGLKSVVDIYTALFSPNSLSASSAFNVLLE